MLDDGTTTHNYNHTYNHTYRDEARICENERKENIRLHELSYKDKWDKREKHFY
jgi:hypothetical protein